MGPDRWDARYREGIPRWDLGGAPPVLPELLAELPETSLRVLVPGAGHGHDALAWAAAGHRVTAVDYAPLAVAGMIERVEAADVRMTIHQGDVLDLPEAFTGRFDAVWEQTCFCALARSLRADYVLSMANALRPAGTFYGLFWNHGWEDGPPFDVTPELVRSLFLPSFSEVSLKAVEHSAPGRANEFLTVLTLLD